MYRLQWKCKDDEYPLACLFIAIIYGVAIGTILAALKTLIWE